MKTTLFLLFISIACFGQGRQSYIDTLNHQMALQLGNVDDFNYSCSDNCQVITMNISENFMQKSRLKSDKGKYEYAMTMLNQYSYLFQTQGFKGFIVHIEGLEPVSKQLK